MVLLKYYSTGATAVFECSYCGLRYKHNKAKYSRELRVVVDYGHLWLDEFRRCCQDKNVTNEQMSIIFKRDKSSLTALKKKLGLSRPFNHDVEIGAMAYYKAKVAELSEEHEELTIALLKEKIPCAYDYLKRYDADWIKPRIVFENEQRHIREYEEQLLGSVQSVVAQLKTDGYPKRQVSYGYIAELAGSARDKLRCRRTIRDLLDGIIESKSDWLLRRAAEVCGVRKALGKPITTKTIKRELYLRETTFRQYEKLIQEVIDTAYE